MVKFISSTFAVIAFIAVANAQAMTGYPKINEIPDVNSPEVQAWLKEIDLTGAPDIPLHKGAPPACPNPPIPNECYWTCDGCAAEDITKCAAPNTWGLTFDDGPSVATPSLLDYLKTQKVSATFFLIGSNVVQYPATVKREIAEGHHLASHTWSHHALTTLTNQQIVAEMKWTEKAVLEATGLRLKYMRPPYGDINNRVRFVLRKLGYIPVDWTGDEFDTKDWEMPGTPIETVVSHFKTSITAYVAGPKTNGFYCLEHDANPMEVAAAKELIPIGQANKVNIANVAQCESDPVGYQPGGTATPPPVGGNSTTVGPQPTGGAQKPGPGNTGSNNATTGPTVGVPKAAATTLTTKVGAISALAVAVAAALFA
ncbi:chitin deacetylase [Actinomortierella ambigua]|nr:chitin deacetylase [Actinomortierella ambigua]